MTSIVDVLADRLSETYARDPGGLVALARGHGIDGRLARRAMAGLPVRGDVCVALCGAVGLDPMTGADCAPRRCDPFNFNLLAVGIVIRMDLNGHSARDAAMAMHLSKSGVSRLCNAAAVSIGTIIKACRYIGTHPFAYCVAADVSPANVSREISAGTVTGRAA